ncbi:MAG: PqqD family protein [Bacteroidetes bacterium]|nr:PqqD family protein [Bacteroidota bacterium]
MRTLNFFERRKILKKVNYLDLVPVRLMEYELLENGRIDILLPRFRNKVWKRALQPRWKGEHIRIHFDVIGSAIWQQIDGRLNVHEICNQLQAAYPEQLNPPEETEKRVTQFLSLLYRERYISFREIMREKNPAGGN